jgi:hypothetical protein
MITIVSRSPQAPARWRDLALELDRWGEEGRIATLWWRDDDASGPSRRLDELLETADGVPVGLAVIPATAERSLAARLEREPASAVQVLQHGWRHHDHSDGDKKSEFPPSRVRDAMVGELAAGRARLAGLFGERALAVFAPPWNRFADALLPLLTAAGLEAISRITARTARWPAPNVFAANVHADLVAWRSGRGFIGEAAALDGLVGHLRERRSGAADPEEPTGILTHHLVQDEATPAFLRRLVAMTRSHRAARWLEPREVFAPVSTAPPAAGRW